jgi:hypothetical protein
MRSSEAVASTWPATLCATAIDTGFYEELAMNTLVQHELPSKLFAYPLAPEVG